MSQITEYHNKYRPTTLAEVFGQDDVARSLDAAIKAKSSRAFLFTGPSGTGKTTLARIIATRVGTKKENLLEIDGASHTGVDAMRELRERIQYIPMGGGTRTVVLDECHMLSKAAWNALLKMLEEPPPKTYWCLCTTEPDKVPDTVATRCARYVLKPVGDKKLFALLQTVRSKEKLKTPDAVLGVCVDVAAGSPRRALTALAAAAQCADAKAAGRVLETTELEPDAEAFQLARAVWAGSQGTVYTELLKQLRSQSAESVRCVVVQFLLSCVLNNPRSKGVPRALVVLDELRSPIGAQDHHVLLLAALAN